jgi:hypothetical protein
MVATFAPVGVAVGVAVAGLLLAAAMVVYRRRLRWVAGQEDALRTALTGAWLDGEDGRRVNEELMPQLRRGSPWRRLRALREIVGVIREHSVVRMGKDVGAALAGGVATVALWGVPATGVAVLAVPVLAVVALVA